MGRRLDDERGAVLVVSLAGLLVLLSVVVSAQHPPVRLGLAAVFGCFIAAGELVRFPLPGAREAAPLGAAAALAYALLGSLPEDGPTLHTAWDVVTLTALATLVGALPHIAVGRAPRMDELARRVLTVAFAAAIFRPLWDAGRLWSSPRDNVRLALVMVLVAVLAALLDAVLSAVVRADRDRSPFAAALRAELRALIGLGSAIAATGVLIALAAQIMGLWALPVFVVPLLLAQFSFRRYATIRETYRQTIRSLSRVTEVAGYTETGHSGRVSQLSLAVGRELGMSEQDLQDLEYASLMHDLGQLSLTDPIPGGATVVAAHEDQVEIARLGSTVIRQTGVLDRVADIVERQADPYRRPHEAADSTLPLASRIIKAANAYDDLVGDSRESSRRLEAIERLRLSMAYDFDPVVVQALARVTEHAAAHAL
jgi:hypothetical protein